MAQVLPLEVVQCQHIFSQSIMHSQGVCKFHVFVFLTSERLLMDIWLVDVQPGCLTSLESPIHGAPPMRIFLVKIAILE